MDRHVRLTNRPPSVKRIIENIEKQLAVEETEAGMIQLKGYLDYWQRRLKDGRKRNGTNT